MRLQEPQRRGRQKGADIAKPLVKTKGARAGGALVVEDRDPLHPCRTRPPTQRSLLHACPDAYARRVPSRPVSSRPARFRFGMTPFFVVAQTSAHRFPGHHKRAAHARPRAGSAVPDDPDGGWEGAGRWLRLGFSDGGLVEAGGRGWGCLRHGERNRGGERTHAAVGFPAAATIFEGDSVFCSSQALSFPPRSWYPGWQCRVRHGSPSPKLLRVPRVPVYNLPPAGDRWIDQRCQACTFKIWLPERVFPPLPKRSISRATSLVLKMPCTSLPSLSSRFVFAPLPLPQKPWLRR